MPVSGHPFIHPWFHADETWAGFHIEFCGAEADFPKALDRLAKHPSVAVLDHRFQWFVPATTPEIVASASALPEGKIVFLVPSPTGTAQDIEAGLRQQEACLGLLVSPGAPFPPPGKWDCLVFAASHARTLPTYQLHGLAARSTLAVTGLRSRNDVAWAVDNRFSLVTGEYLLNRSVPSSKPDMMRTRLLKLLALISSDADTCEIEEIFRQEPKLAYGLLRLVNSAAMAPNSPITSFGQAITMLGRQQLQRWLQLLVYADPNDGQHPNPLLLQAAARGRLMAALAHHLQPPLATDTPSDAAFMTGAFSLLDVLLNLSMPEILQQLPLHHSVHAALEERQGPLGDLLTAISAADNRDTAYASQQLSRIGIDGNTWMAAQLNALTWASHIRAPSA